MAPDLLVPGCEFWSWGAPIKIFGSPFDPDCVRCWATEYPKKLSENTPPDLMIGIRWSKLNPKAVDLNMSNVMEIVANTLYWPNVRQPRWLPIPTSFSTFMSQSNYRVHYENGNVLIFFLIFTLSRKIRQLYISFLLQLLKNTLTIYKFYYQLCKSWAITANFMAKKVPRNLQQTMMSFFSVLLFK